MPERQPVQPEIVDEHGLPLRQLERADQLRALAHPRRMQIFDLLMADGPLTASQCAAALGDSAASCSYHLRQLARFGFVEEAEGGHGRNRPWRWVPLGNRIQAGGSPAEQAAAEALAAVLDARNLERIRRYHAQQPADPWRDSAASSDYAVRITEDELVELGSKITALVAPLQARTFAGAVPADARLVDVLTYLMPRPDDRGADGRTAATDVGQPDA